MHMRVTRERRAVVLGLLYPMSIPGLPATITAVVEQAFDLGVEALRAKGVVPEAVDPQYLTDAITLGKAREAILRAHGLAVGPEDDDTEVDEPPEVDEPDTRPKPLHQR